MKLLHISALLLSQLAALAAINIMIDSDFNNQIRVSHSGTQGGIINDPEARIFQLTQDALIDAARRYFGGLPLRVHFHDLVENQPLYAAGGYQPTTCITSVNNGRVISDERTTESLVRHELRNDHPTDSATYTVDMFTEAEATASSRWQSIREINTRNKINYQVRIGPLDMSWSGLLGQPSSQSSTLVLGMQFQIEVVVPPNTTRYVEISATKRIITVIIDYILELSGVAMTRYFPAYQGRSFWAHQIKNMLAAAHIPTQRFVTEIIEMTYFYGANMNMYDGSNKLIETQKIQMTTRPKRAGKHNRGTTVKCLPSKKD